MIDEFGHSTANMALFHDIGFDAVFMSRISHTEREERKKNEAMTFLWRPLSKHFGA
jgi:hypothetical protein